MDSHIILLILDMADMETCRYSIPIHNNYWTPVYFLGYANFIQIIFYHIQVCILVQRFDTTTCLCDGRGLPDVGVATC